MVFSVLGEVPEVIPASSRVKLSKRRLYVYYFSWQSFRARDAMRLDPHIKISLYPYL